MKLLGRLVVDGDGHLRVGVEGELDIVAGPAPPRRLVARQLQVLAAPARPGGEGDGDMGTEILIVPLILRKLSAADRFQISGLFWFSDILTWSQFLCWCLNKMVIFLTLIEKHTRVDSK